jgi:hypothetical protein
MVMVQLGVDIAEAFVRLRAYAYAHDRWLANVASDIVARRLRLHDDPGEGRRPMTHLPPAPRAAPRPAADLPAPKEKVITMDSDLLSDAFVGLADTMVDDFDVIDFLHMLTDRSVKLLSVSAAGVLLADPRGELRVAAASSEAAGLIELFQIQNDQGPCLDCFRTGQPVSVAGLAGLGQRWPQFAAAATRAGFGTVNALPMRLRDHVIGALNLFAVGTSPLGRAELRIGQALADVATIGLLQERNVRRAETLAEQLQAALNSRVIIEQAKGRLAERLGLDMDQAFTMLRDQARRTSQRLNDVARYVIDSPTAGFPPPPRR